MANRIQLNGDYRQIEGIASGVITPGMLLETTNAAASNSRLTVKAHATQGGYAEADFAVEDALQGNLITDDYADGATVEHHIEQKGSVVYALIKAGEDIDIGDELISNGDGTLIENGSEGSGVTVRQIIGYAIEAVDLTGSTAVDTRIAVRIL